MVKFIRLFIDCIFIDYLNIFAFLLMSRYLFNFIECTNQKNLAIIRINLTATYINLNNYSYSNLKIANNMYFKDI